MVPALLGLWGILKKLFWESLTALLGVCAGLQNDQPPQPKDELPGDFGPCAGVQRGLHSLPADR